MTLLWEDLSGELVDRLGIGVEAIWALVWAAQSGALALALVEPLDEDLSLSDAATVLGDALAELELLRPELASGGVAGDLGPVPLDGLSGYRTAIAGLLGTALDAVVIMLRERDLDTPEVLGIASVASLVGAGRELVTGRIR